MPLHFGWEMPDPSHLPLHAHDKHILHLCENGYDDFDTEIQFNNQIPSLLNTIFNEPAGYEYPLSIITISYYGKENR